MLWAKGGKMKRETASVEAAVLDRRKDGLGQAIELYRQGFVALAAEVAHAAILGLPPGTAIYAVPGEINPIGLRVLWKALGAR